MVRIFSLHFVIIFLLMFHVHYNETSLDCCMGKPTNNRREVLLGFSVRLPVGMHETQKSVVI